MVFITQFFLNIKFCMFYVTSQVMLTDQKVTWNNDTNLLSLTLFFKCKTRFSVVLPIKIQISCALFRHYKFWLRCKEFKVINSKINDSLSLWRFYLDYHLSRNLNLLDSFNSLIHWIIDFKRFEENDRRNWL